MRLGINIVGCEQPLGSGGRATLGLGAAWYEREHLGLGVSFPPTAERFERLEETLRICRQMWDPQHDGPFEGKHYQLAETLCLPAPVSAPHPEIMIGRDCTQIRKTAIYAGPSLRGGDLGAFTKEMAEYARLGIDTVMVSAPSAEPIRWIEDRVAPAVRRLAEAG